MTTDLSDFVVLHDATLVTDSKRVAKNFKKRHDNALRAFDKLECSSNFCALTFKGTVVVVRGPKGATRKECMVRMTKAA